MTKAIRLITQVIKYFSTYEGRAHIKYVEKLKKAKDLLIEKEKK